MKNGKPGKKSLIYYSSLAMGSLIFLSAMVSRLAISPASTEFTVITGKSSYYMGENFDIYANLILNGSPIADSLIGLEINDPNGLPVAYRALQTNSTPEGRIMITSITPGKIVSLFPLVFVPKTSFKIGDIIDFNITLQNISNENLYNARITTCVYDSANTLLNLSPQSAETSIVAHGSLSAFIKMGETIPPWASIGEAKVYVNVFNKLREHRLVPYGKEKSSSFIIANKFGAESHAYAPIYNPSRTNYTYSLTYRLGPYPTIGRYEIYATASYNYQTVLTTFNVQYADFPPEARFTWSPVQPYFNQTVDFDASASTSGGTITKYEWDWETDGVFDATGMTNSTKYETWGDHNVTLKVTDSNGKWATSTRPITVLPPTPPEARFTYDPSNPRVSTNVNFDASTTTLGWNGTGFAPIVSYKWDFGDGNITTVSSPTITHVFLAEGVHNVTLNVTDTRGWWDDTWQAINVTIGTGLMGDLDGNGAVDIFDLVIVAAQFGRPIDPPLPIEDPRADVNKDGVVDIFDLVIVANDFGKTYP